MKLKYILLTMFCLIICQIGEAQILKKLTKKAGQAAERTVLNKTDEIVTETTENTIDDVVNSDEKNAADFNSNSSNNSANNGEQRNPVSNTPFSSGKNVAKELPDTYAFDWEYKTELKSEKNEAMDMNYLIGSANKDYFGMEMSNTDIKKQGGNMLMVMDSKTRISTMFMSANGQKMAQTSKMPEIKENNKKEPDYSFKEIGKKIILGYESYGMEIENADYISTVYFTLDAPVSFSAFFAFANGKNTPKGFDPALLQVLKEDALIMEMTAINKKKPKESFTMTAISLEQKETIIKTSDYQIMNMGF